QGAEKSSINRTNAIELRMLFQHLLENLCGFNRFAVIIEGARAKSSNQRMIGLGRRTLVEFGERVVVPPLISEDARAIVTGDDSFSGIQPYHAIERAHGAIFITIQPR